MIEGASWRRFTADAQVFKEHGLLHGIVLLTSVTGGDISLYEGADIGSGRLIDTFEGLADVSWICMFPKPLYLSRGLYLDVGSNVTSVLVIYEHLPTKK